MPSFMTESIASGEPTPSMTQKIASLIIGINTLLDTNPGIIVDLHRRLAQGFRKFLCRLAGFVGGCQAANDFHEMSSPEPDS